MTKIGQFENVRFEQGFSLEAVLGGFNDIIVTNHCSEKTIVQIAVCNLYLAK